MSGSSQRNSLNKLLLVTERRTLSIATRCENEMHNWLLTFKKILKEFQIMHPEIKSHETLSNTDSIIDINNCNNETSLELYFNRFTCGLDLLKDFAPQLVNYHSRFSKSYQNECSIISDEINTPLQERILMEVKRNFGMSKIELDECLENLKVHEKCVIDYSELMDQLSSIQARVHCKKLTHLDLKKTQHQAFRLSCTRDVILNLCRSCGISKINSVFKECGHFVFCNTCALQLIAEGKECPYCSAPIRSIIKVYEC